MEQVLKNKICWLNIFLLIITFLTGCKNTNENNSIKVIFDTDIGNDIDDVLALQMLINYHKSDLVDL
ncbi:MAG: hypothetical protein PHE29_08515 [Tissierellia bacterium]|nr:hypothetical protein [Tissierellia bacterium]